MSMDDIFNKWKQTDFVEQVKQRINFKGNNQDDDFIQLLLSGFQSLQFIIYVMEVRDGKYVYSYANEAGLEILQSDQSLFGKTFEDVLSKESAENMEQHYREAVMSNEVTRFEDEMILQSGEEVIQETTLTPFSFQEQKYVIAVVKDITEKNRQWDTLIQSKRRLEENEQRLSSLVDHNKNAVYMFNKSGYFLEVNQTTENMSGYSSGNLIGKHFSNIVVPRDREEVEEQFQLAVQGHTVDYETTIYHKDGHEIHVYVQNIPYIINGEIKGVYGMATDITSEKKLFEEMRMQNNFYNSLLKDNTDTIVIIDNNHQVQYVNDAFINLFGFAEKEVLGEEMLTVPDWLKTETDEIQNQVLQGKKIQDLHAKRQRKSGELLDMSLTFSPIYDETDHIIGMSITGRDITNTINEQRQIKKEMEEFELVWKHTTNAICLIGYDGSIIRSNPGFEEMFGVKSEPNKKMSLSDIQPEYLNNQMDSLLSRLSEDRNPIVSSTKRKRKDGTEFDAEVTYTPIQEGNMLAIATYRDVTDSNALLEEIKEREEMYRQIAESLPEAIFIYHKDKVDYVNQQGLELLNAKNSNQVVGKGLSDFIHPKNRKHVIEQMKEAEQQLQEVEPSEEKFLTLDGETFYAETLKVPVTIHGRTSILVLVRDITAKRRAEQAMKESEERFRIIAENSTDIIKVLDSKRRVTYASPTVEHILGYPVREIIGKPYIHSIHPEDTEVVERHFTNMLQTKENFEMEVRQMHQEGYSIWMRSHVIPNVNEQGEIEKIVVICKDISENKRKEEKLSKMAFYDQLTGLPNRRLFNDRLEQAMYTTDRTGKQTALMMMDCDKFKDINDTLGHDVGDEVIKEFGRRVKLTIRKTDTVSRVGGDEFTVVLPELKSELDAIEVGNRILENVRKPMQISGHEIEITTSIGISFYPTGGRDSDQIFKQADENLYKAKERGGNTLFTDIY
ncbi:PAS domain S-box protein [Oceanobacillus salinisoli]|uniref:PAS domain S-box protein n=1 Tax=Oceanobacillus salinisoli TaxID=2678611 RepID=UPI0018CC1BCA|nr:PAS domain S-box protein [Oceanobacillus salinisoli]